MCVCVFVRPCSADGGKVPIFSGMSHFVSVYRQQNEIHLIGDYKYMYSSLRAKRTLNFSLTNFNMVIQAIQAANTAYTI